MYNNMTILCSACMYQPCTINTKNKKTRDITLLMHFVGIYKMTSPTLEMIGMRRFCNRGHSLMPWTSIIQKNNSGMFSVSNMQHNMQ